MTHGGYSLLQTIESNAIGAAVGAIVGGTVSGLYKRAVRLEARRIEAALLTLDHLLGGSAAAELTAQKGTMLPTLAQYRKGLAAGAGVIVVGVLTWVETANLEPILGPLVPEPYRPLVGVLLGGIALTASVILTKNAPKPEPLDYAPAAYPLRAPAATPYPSAALASLVADVAERTAPVSSETSMVSLLPAPVHQYQ